MYVCVCVYVCVRVYVGGGGGGGGGEMRKHSYNVQMVHKTLLFGLCTGMHVCNYMYDINMFVVQPTCNYIHVHVVPTCSSNANDED